ncbi:response regulator [Paenibacillus xylanexedens]|uniref:response regulator transcription factor n=1 Tax=Paenibacillus xylanexedens TaxID=528191 RepID=UPI0011AA22B1|nr:response regulator [Paenibacillus xylanexedens]
MKKVMIVDDEIGIRENIRNSVQWEKEGFHYCGDAPDGELALPLIEEWAPDILITDIKMPFMNGLELASIIRAQKPQIKIIIMSGHDEFSYAQEAIRLGVTEYCLKPVSATELLQILHEVSQKMDDEEQRLTSLTMTKEKLLADLCGGLIGTSDAIDSAKKLSLSLSAKFYTIVIMDIRPHDDSQNSELLLNKTLRILEECCSVDVELLSYIRSRTERVLLLKSSSENRIMAYLEQLRGQIRLDLEQQLNCSVVIGIGSHQERLQGIHVSYLEADEDKYITRLTQQNKASLREIHLDEKMNILLDRSRFLEFLKIGDPHLRDSFVKEFAAPLQSMDWNSSSYGVYLLNDLTLESFRIANQIFRMSADPDENIRSLQQMIRGITSWEACTQYLCDLLDQLWQRRAASSGKYSDVIDQVKAYVSGQYNNEQVSLKSISAHVRISPSHLSKIFSQETGQTITEYLTQVRIGKAKELLKTTSNKTFEIAFKVGYNDPHYFSNIFKKTTGCTPKEYRTRGAVVPDESSVDMRKEPMYE